MRHAILAVLIAGVATFDAAAQYPPGVTRFDGWGLGDLVIAPDGTAYAKGFSPSLENGIYRLEPSGPVLVHAHKQIFDLEPALDGSLWFSTNAAPAGLNELRTDGSVVTVVAGDAGVTWDMTTATDGAIWFIGFSQQGVTRISASGATSTAGSGFIRDLAPGPDGSVWALNRHDHRLSRFSAQGVTLVDVPISFNPLYTTMAPAADGGVWVASAMPPATLTRLNSAGQVVETSSLPPYKSAYIASDGTIFLGIDAGILRIANGVGDLLALPALPPPFAPCYRRAFHTIGATPDGVMWFGEGVEFTHPIPDPGCVDVPNALGAGLLRVAGFAPATSIPTLSQALLVALALGLAGVAAAGLTR